MIELLSIAQGIVERGLIFGIVVASVYLAARIINFNNLSTEGAFGLGGAFAALLLTWHINPWITLPNSCLKHPISQTISLGNNFNNAKNILLP